MNSFNKYKKYKLKYLQIKNLKGGNLTNEDIDSFLEFLEKAYNINDHLRIDIKDYLYTIKDDIIVKKIMQNKIGHNDFDDTIKSFLYKSPSFFEILKKMENDNFDLYNKLSLLNMNSFESRIDIIFQELNKCVIEIEDYDDTSLQYRNNIKIRFLFLKEFYKMFIHDIKLYNNNLGYGLYSIDETYNGEDWISIVETYDIFNIFINRLVDFFRPLNKKLVKDIWNNLLKHSSFLQVNTTIITDEEEISDHIFYRINS